MGAKSATCPSRSNVSETTESVVLPYLTMLMCDLFRGSCKSCAVEVESYAANGGLVGRYDGCRFLNVSQVHQGHSPCPLARVGQQGVVGVGTQTAETWVVRRQDEGMREAHGTYNITLGLKKSLKKLIVWTKLPEPHTLSQRRIQWNCSNLETNGTEESVLLIAYHRLFLGK